MKIRTFTNSLGIIAIMAMMTATANAETVTPTDVASSTPAHAWGGGPINVIDSSGLTDVGGDGEDANDTHANGGAGITWYGGDGGDNGPANVASEWLVFDLGSITDVSAALVWNLNQNGFTHLGVEAMDISATATGTGVGDASGWAGTTTVNLAEGIDTAQSVAVSFSGVRFIRFDNFDNYAEVADSYDSNVALNEVRFEGVASIPEPSTAILAGLGLVGVCFRRRRRK